MKMPHPLASALLLGLCAATSFAAIERLPVETFAKTAATGRARMSPDGKHLAYLTEEAGRQVLRVLEFDTNEVKQLILGDTVQIGEFDTPRPKEAQNFQWVGNRRLLIHTAAWDGLYGVVATNIDGTGGQAISGYEDGSMALSQRRLWIREVIHRYYDKDDTVLMLDRHEGGPGLSYRPDVLRVNTQTGITKLVVKNPGEVGAWGADADGVVRVGILSHGDLSGVIYRESEGAEWRTILPLKDRRTTLRPVGFDSANDRILIAAQTAEKRWTIFPLDPKTGDIGNPLLSDSEYDILPQRFIPTIDGHALAAPFYSPKKDILLGIRYVTDAPRVKWFDPQMAKMQASIDRLAKDTVNLLIDVSLDGKRQLWFGFSDQNPGVYYLADLEAKKIRAVAQTAPWIKPAQMAPMLAIKYQARDGLTIHGYLTVPVGHQPKNLPMVVMPHGGPWVRDFWGYDEVVQLLANRGYAVLQMNYRGSPGYGDALFTQAKRQIGKQIQDDIEDGTRWAIASGVADPKRIAIFGGSYGGYSTFFALGKSPGMYRCGVSFAGVSDWYEMFYSSDVGQYKAARRHWVEQIGDPTTERDMLREISPVSFADRIAAPLLILQGKEDRRVPPDQARRMIAALEKTGRKPEVLFVSDVGHSFGRERHRVQFWKTMVDFLEKHLGPGVE